MQMQQAQVGRQMCQGLMRVAMGLMACGALPNPDMPFNSELTRFEQRFAFLGFMQRPVPLVYDQFCTAMDVTGQCCCSSSAQLSTSISNPL